MTTSTSLSLFLCHEFDYEIFYFWSLSLFLYNVLLMWHMSWQIWHSLLLVCQIWSLTNLANVVTNLKFFLGYLLSLEDFFMIYCGDWESILYCWFYYFKTYGLFLDYRCNEWLNFQGFLDWGTLGWLLYLDLNFSESYRGFDFQFFLCALIVINF